MVESQDVRDALTVASRAFKAAGADALRSVGLHAGQNFLLDALVKEDSLGMGELARRLHVEVPTISRMTQRMEAAGLVRRSADPRDARRTTVMLTRRGRHIAAQVPALLDDLIARAVVGLSDEDLERLRTSLRTIADNLGWGEEANRRHETSVVPPAE